MTLSLSEIEAEIDRYEAELIDQLAVVQEAAEIVTLILAGDGSALSKSRRLTVLRKGTQRGKRIIAFYEITLARLEAHRRRMLAGEVDG
jgi:hypothetical protein